MAKRKGNYVAGPGRDPLSKKYGEELDRTTIRVPKSYLDHVRKKAKERGIKMSDYFRLLIERDMQS